MKFTLIFIIIFTFYSVSLTAQIAKSYPKSYGLVFGYHGVKASIGEFGIAKGIEFLTLSHTKSDKTQRPHAILNMSYLYDFKNDANGLGIGFSMAYWFALKVDVNYFHTPNIDFFGVKPSIGFSIYGIEFLYERNFKVGGEMFDNASNRQFTIRYYFMLFVQTRDKEWKLRMKY